MSQEHCSQNHRYLSNCVNLGSLLVIVMLITYLEQCSATQLQNTTTAGHDCWFNWTQILDGHILGLETPCVGLNCTNGTLTLVDCNITKPKREDGCERERHRGTFPECCKWVRAC
uniref:Putative kDa family member n=1 Tax=Rhipicephalus microplus TaxID=6941 RepID=A0A6G5A7P3_RHIMP